MRIPVSKIATMNPVLTSFSKIGDCFASLAMTTHNDIRT